MIVKAWNNGEHKATGAGYGVKLSVEDRDSFFDPEWETVFVTLPNGVKLEANVKKASFWNNTCIELINKKFGQWCHRQKPSTLGVRQTSLVQANTR